LHWSGKTGMRIGMPALNEREGGVVGWKYSIVTWHKQYIN